MSELTLEQWISVIVLMYCTFFTAFWHVRGATNWLIARYRKNGYVHNEVNDLLWKIGRPSAGQDNATRIVGEDFEIVIKQWSKDDETGK